MSKMCLPADHLPAGHIDGQASGWEELRLLLMVQGAETCLQQGGRAADTGRMGMLHTLATRCWVTSGLNGMPVWSLDYKVHWEAEAPSADFARDSDVPYSLRSETSDQL